MSWLQDKFNQVNLTANFSRKKMLMFLDENSKLHKETNKMEMFWYEPQSVPNMHVSFSLRAEREQQY